MFHEASYAEIVGLIELSTGTGKRWLRAEHIMGIERDQAEDFTVVQMLTGGSLSPITVKEFPEEIIERLVHLLDAERTYLPEEVEAKVEAHIHAAELEQESHRRVYDKLGIVHVEGGGSPQSTFRFPKVGEGEDQEAALARWKQENGYPDGDEDEDDDDDDE